MFKHYLTTALRNFWRFRFSTGINVLGLSLGMVCFVASFVFIDNLVESDRHFTKSPRIYVITQKLWIGATQQTIPPLPQAAPPAAKYLKVDFPQLEAVARALPIGSVAASTGGENISLHAAGVDPEFLQIFDLPFVSGESKSALIAPHSAIVTESAAVRLFGTRDVLGRRVLLQNRAEVTITAVISAIAQPSHLGDTARAIVRFDILVPMDFVRMLTGSSLNGFPVEPDGDAWGVNYYYTYALLPAAGTLTPQAFNAGLKSFGDRHVPKGPLRSQFGAVPVTHIALQSLNAFIDGIGLQATTVLFLLSSLVLAVACLNYANLATAVAILRSKEVGMRKIVGARRAQLIWQHMLEAALLSLIALLIVLIGLWLTMPLLNTNVGFDLRLTPLMQPSFWGLLLGLIFAVSAAGGAYPALVLSGFRPIHALRGGATRASSNVVQPFLVGVQFTAASFLLILVILMHDQGVALQRVGLGLARDPTIVVANDAKQSGVNFATLRDELLNAPEIKSVTASGRVPWSAGGSHQLVTRSPEPAAKTVQTLVNHVSYGFFETLGIGLIAGRTFDDVHGDEMSGVMPPVAQLSHVIIDRALALELGWQNPSDAVGQTLFGGTPSSAASQIIGVVENDYPRLIGLGANSNLYHLTPQAASIPIVRVARDRVPQALAHIDSVWQRLAPNIPIKRSFMDELFDRAYEIFAAINTVFNGLAVFAFVISAMSLFGMAVHIATRRAHEIGIRKTLGANGRQVMILLLRDFTKPVVIANLIAWPFALFAGQIYLHMFAQHTELSLRPFTLSLITTVLLAWIAVSAQTFRAASGKPATVLRHE